VVVGRFLLTADQLLSVTFKFYSRYTAECLRHQPTLPDISFTAVTDTSCPWLQYC